MAGEESIDIRIGAVDHATIAARLQIDFGDEFGDPSPPLPVLERRFRALLADPAAFVLFAGDPHGSGRIRRGDPAPPRSTATDRSRCWMSST